MKLDTVICGSVFDKLPEIPTGSVNCCVTSPPYWGLRDYGVDGQLGLEKTPEEYIAKMVAVFREVWRVLQDDGTLWLNLGDSYVGSGKGGGGCFENMCESRRRDTSIMPRQNKGVPGLKPKDLCGIPWRVALALQADGWYLRQDIIWSKPNPMPESVRDRCTKAHEYIFLMSKKPRYFYDAEAIREGEQVYTRKAGGYKTHKEQMIDGYSPFKGKGGFADCDITTVGRNKRSVWTVTTKPYSEAHFATFPPDLILPCILAGCPAQVCKKCGEPRRRIIERIGGPPKGDHRKNADFNTTCKTAHKTGTVAGSALSEIYAKYGYPENKTTGWTDCNCSAGFDGGIVLDPFMGSGTVGLVAYQNNRHYIGIELNPEYCKLGRIEAERDKYALFESSLNLLKRER